MDCDNGAGSGALAALTRTNRMGRKVLTLKLPPVNKCPPPSPYCSLLAFVEHRGFALRLPPALRTTSPHTRTVPYAFQTHAPPRYPLGPAYHFSLPLPARTLHFLQLHLAAVAGMIWLRCPFTLLRSSSGRVNSKAAPTHPALPTCTTTHQARTCRLGALSPPGPVWTGDLDALALPGTLPCYHLPNAHASPLHTLRAYPRATRCSSATTISNCATFRFTTFPRLHLPLFIFSYKGALLPRALYHALDKPVDAMPHFIVGQFLPVVLAPPTHHFPHTTPTT